MGKFSILHPVPFLAVFILAVGYFMSSVESSSTTAPKVGVKATYGETCSKENRCDSRALLTCVNSTCDCLKENEMTFDTNQGKCVVLSGERCSYKVSESKGKTEEKRWIENLPCVENAACQDGYCSCTSNYTESSDGLCIPKSSHLEPCVDDNDCVPFANLTCSNGLCRCNEKESVFDSHRGVCVAKVGASCEKYGACVKNAFCKTKRYHYYRHDPQYEMCECLPQHKETNDGRCLGVHGSDCDANSPCANGLTCMDSSCVCPYSQYQSYNHTTEECVSELHGPCKENINGETLTFSCSNTNSECRLNEGVYECQCKEGFVESGWRGECKRSYGSKCKSRDECDDVDNLICRNETCTCKDFQVYDPLLERCRGLVGAKCNHGRNESCIEGAYCKERRSWYWYGTCRCVSPLQADSNRNCKTLKDTTTSSMMEYVSGAMPGSGSSVRVDEYVTGTTSFEMVDEEPASATSDYETVAL